MFKIPVSVLVVIYSEQREVLLLQRKDNPEFWQSVTGSLEQGEEPLQAAAREVLEETGLQPTVIEDLSTSVTFPIKGVWRSRYAPDVTHNVEHWFCLRLPARMPIQLHAEEHLDYRWLGCDEALALATSPTNQQAIDTICKRAL